MAEPVPIWIEQDPEPAPGDFSDLARLASRLLTELGANGVAIAHESGHGDGMVCIVSCGRTAPPKGAVVDVNSGITGRCLRESRSMRCFDTELDPRVDKDACRRLGIRSLAIAPFYSGSKAIGFVELFSERPGAFDPGQLAKLEIVARRVAEIVSEDEGGSEPPSATPVEELQEVPRFPEALHPPQKQGPSVPSAQANDLLPSFGQGTARQSRSFARTVAWLALVLVGSVAALSLPRLVHSRSEHRETSVAQPTASAPVVNSSEPGQNLSIRPSDAVDIQKPVSASLHDLGQQARAGDSQAQFVLASHYESGEGIAKDPVKAAVWYIVSGNSGNQAAKEAAVQITRQLRPFEIAQVRFNVGKMFADGIGTEKDAVSAYLWFALAEAAGDVRAKAEEGKLAESMTVAEINEAQTRASSWLSGHRRQTTASLHPPK